MYVIPDILLEVLLNTNKTTTSVITDTSLKVALNNKADNHVILITDMLLKVALNTNKTGQDVVSYNRDIVESGIKDQEN